MTSSSTPNKISWNIVDSLYNTLQVCTWNSVQSGYSLLAISVENLTMALWLVATKGFLSVFVSCQWCGPASDCFSSWGHPEPSVSLTFPDLWDLIEDGSLPACVSLCLVDPEVILGVKTAPIASSLTGLMFGRILWWLQRFLPLVNMLYYNPLPLKVEPVNRIQ